MTDYIVKVKFTLYRLIKLRLAAYVDFLTAEVILAKIEVFPSTWFLVEHYNSDSAPNAWQWSFHRVVIPQVGFNRHAQDGVPQVTRDVFCIWNLANKASETR